MAAMRPDGSGVEMPIGRGRPRGRTLSDAAKTRLRDLILALLVDGCGVSVPDAMDVLAKATLHRSKVYDRLSKCPRGVRQVMAEILRESGHAA